jgi:pimeloyl-ACP methyl ester carboxylesterase
LEQFRTVVGTALRAIIGKPPTGVFVRKGPTEVKVTDGVTAHLAVLGRDADAVPTLGIASKKWDRSKVVVWVHPDGKRSILEDGKPTAAVRTLLDTGFTVIAPDLLGTGEQTPDKPFAVDPRYAGFTFGYNRCLLANRVRDVLTVVTFARTMLKAKTVHLVGWDTFGPVTVLAKALAGQSVDKLAADLNGFRFDKITDVNDPMLLPGAVKYGGLPAFLALCAPDPVLVHGHAGTGTGRLPAAAYSASGAESKLIRVAEKWPTEKVVGWLIETPSSNAN